jgi:hypothetical protein
MRDTVREIKVLVRCQRLLLDGADVGHLLGNGLQVI